MFSLEMCHLLNYSLCFYFAIGPTFVLELRASYILCLYSLPPGVRFYTPESPGANVVNGGGFPSLYSLHPVLFALNVVTVGKRLYKPLNLPAARTLRRKVAG